MTSTTASGQLALFIPSPDSMRNLRFGLALSDVLARPQVRVRTAVVMGAAIVRSLQAALKARGLDTAYPSVMHCLDGSVDLLWRASAEAKFLINCDEVHNTVVIDYAATASGEEVIGGQIELPSGDGDTDACYAELLDWALRHADAL